MAEVLEVHQPVRGATKHVRRDELAYYLSEINLPGRPGEGHHRYQIIGVIRNDKLCDCHIDMGPVTKFPGIDQLRIITAVIISNNRTEALHTVEEAMRMADSLRAVQVDKSEWPILDLMAGYQEHEERKRRKKLASRR